VIDKIHLQFAGLNETGVSLQAVDEALWGKRVRRAKHEGEWLNTVQGYEAFKFKFTTVEGRRLYKRIDMNPNYTNEAGVRVYPTYQAFRAAAEELGIHLVMGLGRINRMDYCVDVPLPTKTVIRGLDARRLQVNRTFEKANTSGAQGYTLGTKRAVTVYDKRPNVDAPFNTRIEVRLKGVENMPWSIQHPRHNPQNFDDLAAYIQLVVSGHDKPFSNFSVSEVRVLYPTLPDVENDNGWDNPNFQFLMRHYLRYYPLKHELDVLLGVISLSEMRRRFRREHGLRDEDTLERLGHIRTRQGIDLENRLRRSLHDFLESLSRTPIPLGEEHLLPST